MVKVGVISDTHDKLEPFESALNTFQALGIKTLIHAGDWKGVSTLEWAINQLRCREMFLYGVLGNNDLDVAGFLSLASHNKDTVKIVEGELRIPFDGKSIAVFHGHVAATLKALRSDTSLNYLVLGHTHKPRVETVGNTTTLNPGSTAFSIPRTKDFHPTVAVIDIVKNSANIVELP